MLPHFSPGGGGKYSFIWVTQVPAAGQGPRDFNPDCEQSLSFFHLRPAKS